MEAHRFFFFFLLLQNSPTTNTLHIYRGPIVWVLGGEMQTLETRTSGAAAVVFCNYIFSFLIGEPIAQVVHKGSAPAQVPL